ncbi:MAG: P-II family nitrogen regulator [Kiritimatiellales bacterium]|nr:P-II family nitrogen regulator [Kiritimatiellales bacterium]
MKLIIAYIQPEALNQVKQALYESEIYKLSVTNAMGCGQQKGYHETYRGADIEVNLLKKVRLEIAVNDDFVKATTDAIIKGARTGNIGDGKIFILDLPECIRIRTGEKGHDAIG